MMFKKKVLTIALSLCLIIPSFNAKAAITTSTNDQTQIKSVITKYFDNQLISIKLQKPEDNDSIVSNKSFKEYSNLSNKLLAEWYKKIDQNLINYKLYLDFNNVTINKTQCTVTATKGLDLVFEKSKDVTQQVRSEKHSITLEKINNKWVINNDIDNTEQDYSLNNTKSGVQETSISDLNEKTQILQNKLDNIEDGVKNFNNMTVQNNTLNTTKATLYRGYNGKAAADYAVDHFESAEDQPGNDCTSFVSRCINAGGIPTTSTWKLGSNAWIRVIELRNYLVNNGIANEYSERNNCVRGDLIQLQHPNGIFGHSVIITYIDPYGTVCVSSHTGAHKNYALYNFYPTSNWTGIRYLKLTN